MSFSATSKLNKWLGATFANSELLQIIVLLVCAGGFLWAFIEHLGLVALLLLLAYVCADCVGVLTNKLNLPRLVATLLVLLLGVLAVIFTAYTLPRLLAQLGEMTTRLPSSEDGLGRLVNYINQNLPEEAKISEAEAADYFTNLVGAISSFIIDNTAGVLGNIFSAMVFLIITPIFIFFLLKDKEQIAAYAGSLLPKNALLRKFLHDLDVALVAYWRGKLLEASVVGVSTWLVLQFFSVDFSLALSVVIGLSVFIPFVGVVIVTILLAIVAFLQFGTETTFFWVLGLHMAIQIIDGNVLVPLLFAEKVNIHPTVIFAFILFFGSLWGAWGVFLAIPMASLCKCFIEIVKESAEKPT